MDHPQKVLNDAIQMYNSRVAIAISERKKTCRNYGMFVIMPEGATRIVPDMQVLRLDHDQVRSRINPSHPTADGALSMFQRTDADEDVVVFGVIFRDGGVLATTLQVHNADRDRF